MLGGCGFFLQCGPSWDVWKILHPMSWWFIRGVEMFWRACVEIFHMRTLLDLRSDICEVDRNNLCSEKVSEVSSSSGMSEIV